MKFGRKRAMTPEEIRTAADRYANGETQAALAAEYGVSEATCSDDSPRCDAAGVGEPAHRLAGPRAYRGQLGPEDRSARARTARARSLS